MRRDYRITKEPKVMIIPMIDIMLFLLVFFMISTIYMVRSDTIPVSLPAALSSQREVRPNIISVAVREDGAIMFGRDPVSGPELAERIRETLAADKETVFVLRGDRRTSYESVATVLDILKQNGTRHVSIATEHIE